MTRVDRVLHPVRIIGKVNGREVAAVWEGSDGARWTIRWSFLVNEETYSVYHTFVRPKPARDAFRLSREETEALLAKDMSELEKLISRETKVKSLQANDDDV